MPTFAVAGASAPVGLTAATVRPMAGRIGVVLGGQPTPSPQDNAGLLANDTLDRLTKKFLSRSSVESAAVSAEGYTGPQLKRTKPFLWILNAIKGIGFPSIIKGPINRLDPIWGSVDPLDFKSVVKDRQTQGLGFSGFYDAIDGIATPETDIGNRMIPDAAQSFDKFAGGFNRDVSNVTGITKNVNWNKGLNPQTDTDNMIEQKSFFNTNLATWASDAQELVFMERNPDIKGQGFNVVAIGLPIKSGATPPVNVERRGLF